MMTDDKDGRSAWGMLLFLGLATLITVALGLVAHWLIGLPNSISAGIGVIVGVVVTIRVVQQLDV